MGWVLGSRDGKVTFQFLSRDINSPEIELTPDEARDLSKQMSVRADLAEGKQ